MNRPNDKVLGIILLYCRELSRLVAPAEASRFGLKQFDGSTNDFLKDLANAMINGESFDIENDDFYRPIFENMKKELSEIFNECL